MESREKPASWTRIAWQLVVLLFAIVIGMQTMALADHTSTHRSDEYEADDDTLAIVGGVIGLGLLGYYGYNQGWFGTPDEEADMEMDGMGAAAANATPEYSRIQLISDSRELPLGTEKQFRVRALPKGQSPHESANWRDVTNDPSVEWLPDTSLIAVEGKPGVFTVPGEAHELAGTNAQVAVSLPGGSAEASGLIVRVVRP